jgi:UPF0755 protein
MKKLFSLAIIIAIAAGVWFFLTPPGDDSSEKVFIISKGEGVKEISQHLEEQGFVKNKFIFETYVWLKKIQVNFQAGEHTLKKNMRLWEVADVLVRTSGPEERDIKILEGWNNREIGKYLEKENILGEEFFLKELDNFEATAGDYGFLKDRPEEATLEGYLFPDTYRIYTKLPPELRSGADEKTDLVRHILKKILNNFDNKLTPELREEIAKQKKTIFEIITMASIVEKEARGEDMALISDIFWRRIDERIALQSDATVNYATGKYETQPSLDDLEIDSPYNTYKYRGLPKGPIGNSGLEAIRAAIYPKANDYWYFLHTKDGQTIYSKNFSEHKANKAKYLQ